METSARRRGSGRTKRSIIRACMARGLPHRPPLRPAQLGLATPAPPCLCSALWPSPSFRTLGVISENCTYSTQRWPFFSEPDIRENGSQMRALLRGVEETREFGEVYLPNGQRRVKTDLFIMPMERDFHQLHRCLPDRSQCFMPCDGDPNRLRLRMIYPSRDPDTIPVIPHLEGTSYQHCIWSGVLPRSPVQESRGFVLSACTICLISSAFNSTIMTLSFQLRSCFPPPQVPLGGRRSIR